jgi:arylsulfatase A-like enzyme/Flp pilus assembly protein TadD
VRKRLLLLAAPLALAGAVVSLVACAGRAREKLNLLVITLDTTRADRIGAYGNRDASTPNLDRLAGNGIVFENCYSTNPLTLPAHCSLFTGRFPIAHRVRNNGTYLLPAEELTLAEILKGKGYHSFACIASFTLLSKFGLNQGFDRYDETFQLRQVYIPYSAEIPGDVIAHKFAAWIEKDPPRPFFTWLHFYDPHIPYQPHPEVDEKYQDSERSRYDGEIAFVDLQIGKVIRLLEARKLLSSTLIVIVGDHGEAFGEHKEFGHGIFCYDETLKVPLIFHNPALFKGNARIPDRVSLAGVMPTILHYLGMAVPDTVQGKSLHGLIEGKRETQGAPFYFESLYGLELNNWAPVMGIVAGDYKYVSTIEPELYHLGEDPAERSNLRRSRGALARELDQKLRKFLAEHSSLREASQRELSGEDLERLKSLGYIGSGSAASSRLIDPKKGIDLFLQADALRETIKAGKFLEAQQELERIMSRHPGVQLPVFYEIAFMTRKNLGHALEASEILQKAVALFPLNEEFRVMLAIELIAQGDHARAQELCRELLEHNPRFATAYILMGDISLKRGEVAEAVRYYRLALPIEPQNIHLRVTLARLLLKLGERLQAAAMMAEIGKDPAGLEKLDDVETLSETASYFIGNDQLDLALEALNKILSRDPDHVEALLNAGTVHFRMGRFAAALPFFQKAAAVDPGRALAYSNMGAVYFSSFQKNNDRSLLPLALQNFHKALRLDPALSDAYNGRGAVYLVMNEGGKAVLDFRKVIEMNPGDVDAHFNIAYALVSAGRRKEALDLLGRFKQSRYAQLNARDRDELDRLLSEINH